MTEQEQPKNDFMHKLALQIVERRNLVFLIVILGTIFTIFSRSWVKVESDLTTYLPKTARPGWAWTLWKKSLPPTVLPMSWWQTSRRTRQTS